MMKKIGSRLLSAVMALSMLCGLLPAGALAAGSKEYTDDLGLVTLTVSSDDELPASATVTVSCVLDADGELTDLFADDMATAPATEEQTQQYNAISNLLSEKYTGDLSSNMHVYDVYAQSNDVAIAFPAKATYKVNVFTNGLADVSKVYVYDENELQEVSDFTFEKGFWSNTCVCQ